MYWLIIVLALLLFLIWASADIGSNIYLKTMCRAVTHDKVVALTFDDGPAENMTPKVLDVLKEYGVKATFFLVGREVERNSDIVRRMVAEGHIIANHTYSHKGTFPLSSAVDVEAELQQCNKAIASVIGKSPKLFRPPFGVTNPIIGRVVRRSDLRTIGWSIRSLDTINSRSREEVCDSVIKRLHPGAIILLHDRCDDADVLLRRLITSIIEHGYGFTTIDKLINDDVYEN